MVVDTMLEMPQLPLMAAAAVYAFTDQALSNATSQRGAFVLRAPKTGSIRTVRFRVGATVTQAADTDVRIETVSLVNGSPTGTLFGVNTNGALPSASVVANTWVSAPLTADAVVNRGDLIAVVIVPGVSGNYQISTQLGLGAATIGNAPYTSVSTSGAYGAKSANPAVGMPLALEYADGSFAYMAGFIPASASAQIVVSPAGTPDEIALKFRLPFACRIGGFKLHINLAADADIILYDSDGSSVLASMTLDKDVRSSAVISESRAQFPTSAAILANTYYYLAVRPPVGVIAALYIDVASAPLLGVMQGGEDFHYASRVDGGAWTALTTRRPWIAVLIDGIIATMSPRARYQMGVL